MSSLFSKSDLLACALLLGLSLVLVWPVVQHLGWWLWSPGAAYSDLAVTHWPNAHFARRTLWEEGRFPLWRSTIMNGSPFAANPLTGLYYPLNWLFLFSPWLPLAMGFNLSALVHLWLAGVSMYVLMRRGLGVDRWGALTAAAVYEASPKLLAHLGAGHVGWAQAWGWLPLVVLGWEQACKSANVQASANEWSKLGSDRSWQWIMGAGVALAMQFLADVRMAVYTLVLVASLTLAFTLRHSLTSFSLFRLARIGFCILGIFLSLTACQWVPMVALLPETTRSLMKLNDAAVWSLPPRYLAGTLLADHGGFHEWMTYLGVGSLVLAGSGVRALWRERRGRWRVTWLFCIIVGAVWFSLGTFGGLFQVLWRIVPGLSLLRVPPRAWILVIFGVAVLAGFGLKAGRGGRLWRWLSVGVGVLPPMFLLGYVLLFGRPSLNLVMFGVVTPLVILGCGFKVAGLRLQIGGWRLPLRRVVIFLIVVFDLLVVGGTLIEARSPGRVFAGGRDAAAWLGTHAGRFRVYSPSYSIPQHLAELYGLALADGVDPLQLRAYARYLTQAAGLEWTGNYSVTLPPFPEGAEDIRTALKGVTPDVDMLGQLGVRYVASAFPIAAEGLQLKGQFDGVYVYRNLRAKDVVGEQEFSLHKIVLASGDVLFEYQSWPVYVGWVVSGSTLIIILAGCLARYKRLTNAGS